MTKKRTESLIMFTWFTCLNRKTVDGNKEKYYLEEITLEIS